MTKPTALERSWNCALLAQVLIPIDRSFLMTAMASFESAMTNWDTVGRRWWFFIIADPFLYFTWSRLNHSHPAEKMIISSHNRICVNAQQYILNSKHALPHLWSCCHSSWVLNNSYRKENVTCKYTKRMLLPVNNRSQNDWLWYTNVMFLLFLIIYIQ